MMEEKLKTVLMTDTKRLDWLEDRQGYGLISDDFGRWAISSSGMQNIPDNADVPSYIATTFFIEAADWKPSIREAIDYFIKKEMEE